MKTRIIVDSSADLLPEIKEKVTVVPLVIHFGDEEYTDGVNIDHKKFYEKLVETDVHPSTSQPSPVAFASEYEKAFIRDMSNYDLYYMFDTDTKTVVYFGTNDTYIEKGTYTGNFSTGVTITWSHGEWTEKFTHKSGNTATLIDGNGWDWEYKVCDVEKAQKVLDDHQ